MPGPELGEIRAYQKGDYPWDSKEITEVRAQRIIIQDELAVYITLAGEKIPLSEDALKELKRVLHEEEERYKNLPEEVRNLALSGFEFGRVKLDFWPPEDRSLI